VIRLREAVGAWQGMVDQAALSGWA
jgi:hypothetical protein